MQGDPGALAFEVGSKCKAFNDPLKFVLGVDVVGVLVTLEALPRVIIHHDDYDDGHDHSDGVEIRFPHTTASETC